MLFFSLIAFACAPKAYGWARLGHAVVAKVAEDHLTPKAKKALAEYLGGESIVTVASDADIQRPFWTIDLGFVPSNPEAARLVDTKSKKEIKEIVKGDVYEWAHQSAVDSWPAHCLQEGDVTAQDFPVKMRPILFSQLRNAGYRLAALLNDIFG